MGGERPQGYLFPAGLKDMLKAAWLQGRAPQASTWGGPTRRGTSPRRVYPEA